ncbi:lipoteichoic acid synthase yvgj [Fusarium albosuccineum]|uniref:Lipoteichoic acid synthase yvgj n=1 Tax=Fusarium albosuccineum TaxID=1237068 RepID=A0A8H4PIB8_9HYPO|nr:lipoteichoic acid synthase yvgj [Fusarium albosuccineum]
MFRPSALSVEAPLRIVLAVCSRFANRRFFFTFTALAVWSSKIVHVHDHLSAVPAHQFRQWGYSFFAQDVAILVFIRLLLDHWIAGLPILSRVAITLVNSIVMLYNAGLSIISISFYLVAGSEIHLRNVSLPTDPSSRALILSGSVSFTIVMTVTFCLSWLLQDFCYGVWGYAADVVNWPFAATWRMLRRFVCSQIYYSEIPQLDVEDPTKPYFSDDERGSDSLFDDGAQSQTTSLPFRLLQQTIEKFGVEVAPSKLRFILNVLAYIIATFVILALIFSALARPHDNTLIFLSWTTGLLPFVDIASSSPTLQGLPSHFGSGIQRDWDKQSALAKPPTLEWLPKDTKLAGFEDWYNGREHYSADADPMKISNLDQDVLSELHDKLQDVPIKHVMLIFLESTRNDVFPIKKDGFIWNRLASTFADNELPLESQERLANLTPTANYITGDYDDGFEHDEEKKRGGMHFTNAHTTGTYTLKSLIGTLCGIAPLIADFNLDYQHHVYQPCMAQIFEALNSLDDSKDDDAHPFASSKWQSYYYQAATMAYDKQYEMVAGLGFPEEHIISREYLRSENATHGPVTLPNINAFAFEEDPLEDYFRDVFVSAKKNDERVFLTHLTSTSHHAFKMPEREKYVPMANGLDMLSHYINSEGYDDKWLAKILNLLDEQGVANETLVVFVGDHGLSIPENDMVSPYYNPNVGIDHVPMVFSHPMLPAFDVHDAVHSSQILPTIFDLLRETGSLNKAGRQAASDLIHNYEGQSLIRPIRTSTETGQGNWQFTIVNPGRAVITARDARYPERHLVVPVINNVEWRLSNLTADPGEHDSVQGFDFISFLESVERKHGTEVAEWAEEGAFMSRWWVEENSKRWRFGPYGDFNP